MSREEPIFVPTTPEEAVINRRVVAFHNPPHRLELTSLRRNDTEVIDLAQDDDDDDDEVTATDDSDDEEGPIGFVGVSNSSYVARHRSYDSYANGARVLASSNAINQFATRTGFERSAPPTRSVKRMNEEEPRRQPLFARKSGRNHLSVDFEIDSFPTADRIRRRRVEANGLRVLQRPDPNRHEPRVPLEVTRNRAQREMLAAAATSAGAERPSSSAPGLQRSFAIHAGGRHAVQTTRTWQPPVIPSNFRYGDYGTDEFEALPPEPEPAPEDLRSIASLSRGTPAPEDIVSQLPVIAVSEDEVTGKTGDDEDVSCAICMENYCLGDHRKLLPCLHSFHNVCLDQWLAINGSCPICKYRVQ